MKMAESLPPESDLNLIALKKAKTVYNFGLSECNRLNANPSGDSTLELSQRVLPYQNKSIPYDCVIPRHCKHFYLQIFSNRFIFSAGQLNLMGHGTKFMS